VFAAADSTTSGKGDGAGEAFAAAVGAVAIGKESLPDAAERRDVEAAAVAEALARYRQPEEWERGQWADVEDEYDIDYRTRPWEKDG